MTATTVTTMSIVHDDQKSPLGQPDPPVANTPQRLILVVEDDEEAQRYFALALESAGYAVILAGTANEAIRILQEQPVSLVLTDWHLPDGTASVVCEAVERNNRAHTHTPVLLVTGRADLRTLQIENIDVDLWLKKPLSTEKLLAAVDQLLQHAA